MYNFDTIQTKVNKFFKVIIIPLVVANGMIYLIGSFIAMDFDIHNWWCFNHTFGRILLSLFELMILLNITKWYEQYNSR